MDEQEHPLPFYEDRKTKSWLPIRQLSGENVELIKLAVDLGYNMGFTLSLGRGTLMGQVVRFNDLTGRIFLKSGSGNGKVVRNFLIREVKMFECGFELFDEARKRGVL
jgi:hypothetical protein